ncbi:unnamed protein product [Cuscuta epithymum]|uniref:C-terminal processing peptidase n=2 Tax=Cuscuta epithymum TaxID=186058 RepID=A0AAV0EDY7_9ASTE|nr:unnamed protein product [Cuscuta epithymum]
MTLSLCNHSFPPLLYSYPSPPFRLIAASHHKAFITTGASIAISLGLLISPSSLASELPLNQSSAISLVQSNDKDQLNCREDEPDLSTSAAEPDLVTNDGIVADVWHIVNDSFLNTGHRSWSPETWLSKKEDITSTPIQSRARAHDIIRRMLTSLDDPYTHFLSPAEFSKMARYDMTSIGINLMEVPDDNQGVKLKVSGLLLDGPARSAGVRQGDELMSVNGIDVKGKSSFEASSLIQGPGGTLVKLMVKHGKCGPVESVDVERQPIARTPVFYRMEQIDHGSSLVGYVRLKEFNALAKKDIVTAMQRLRDMGASSFVLDLRDNLGGLVQAGVEIAKLFLNEGEMVTNTVGRDPQYIRSIAAESPPLITAPVIILVNRNTASASEIVATALHDNCRAVLVGERTYGKGLIQSVFELQDGSGVVVTVGKYVTPNHMDINGNGIKPDFRNLPTWNEVTKHLSECHKPNRG